MEKAEILRRKARAMMYKKPIVKGLSLGDIHDGLCEISDACGEMEYFYSGDEAGRDAIAEVLGDLDDAWELQTEFSALGADVERMQEDLRYFSSDWFDFGEYDDEGFGRCLFDDLICCEAVADSCGGMAGFDAYENDYFSLDGYSQHAAQEECKKRLMRLKKEELIEKQHAALAVVLNYAGIKYRFDCLQGVYDIMRDKFGHRLELMADIEKAYEALFAADWQHREAAKRDFDRLSDELPAEAWLE